MVTVIRQLPGLVVAIGLGFAPMFAAGHGYMTYPRSRSMDHLAGDTPGWPIAGIKAGLRREPCVGLKFNLQRTTVEYGPLMLRFLFPDGANHVGSCHAFLFDPLDPINRVKIGEADDCARSDHPESGRKGEDIPGHMQVVIPRALPCDPTHCVLQWVWVATHKGESEPQRYEHYDNCADIEIVDAARDETPGQSMSKPQQASTVSPTTVGSVAISELTSIAGHYRVDSVRSGWDEGEIKLIWVDTAGQSWGLNTDPGRPDRLTTDSRNPYLAQGRREFILYRDNSGRILGFDFGDTTFTRDSTAYGSFRADSMDGSPYAGELKLVWENRAGISWGLEPNPEQPDTLVTDSRNPYFQHGIHNFELLRNSSGLVVAYRFGGAVYNRR